MMKALVLGLCALTGLANAQPRTCESVNVEPCTIRINRDLMFLVDASDSMDPNRFQNEMLNYVQSLFCAFDTRERNRAGMITFAGDIIERIPLDVYTPEQWFSKVDEARSQNLCCSCCTPTATAFALTKEIFERVPIGDSFRTVFMVTDGAPWQNEYGMFAWPGINSAEYTWKIVPEQALALKDMSGEGRVRVMMVGVPNKKGNPPNADYFRGIPDPTLVPAGKGSNWQCQTRGSSRNCQQMRRPPFPIVSEPVGKNVFVSKTWDVQSLLDNTVGTLCEVLPTPAPTGRPTTPIPTFAPTFAPSPAPTMSPIKPELDGLDLYILLDRSRSMRWVPDLCRSAPGGNPADRDVVACWKLFLGFVRNVVEKTTAIPYRNSRVGWFDDNSDIKRGLRVWVYGFACSGKQSKPVVVTIGEKIGSLAEFDAALSAAEQIIPSGGTCPGAAIEKAAATIQGTDLLTRIYKSAILFTDGVFYDMPRPRIAAEGLHHFGVLTYSMGIAIPSEGSDWGLTPDEIVRQRNQLLNFVSGDEGRLFNFGLEGFNLLDELAERFVNQLPYDAVKFFPDVAKQPYWCKWTSIARCTEMNPEKTATGKYCKWDYDRRVCLPKTWCNYNQKRDCTSNGAFCRWQNNKCETKPGVQLG